MSSTLAILKITDGTTTVDLLNKDSGFLLSEWQPNIADFKDGGIFQNSPLATGRRLVAYRYENTIETMQLKARHLSADALTEEMQTFRRLLQKAADYWATDWQNTPVYLQARAHGETNTRYCLIHTGRLANDANPYAQPFLQALRPGAAATEDIPFIFERGHWLENAPGTGDSVALSGTQSWTTPEWNVETTTPTGDVTALAQTADGSRLFAGTDDAAKLYASDDDGGTWALLYTFGATTDIVESILCLSGDSDEVRVAVSGAAAAQGAWESSDKGVSFSKFTAATNMYDLAESEYTDWIYIGGLSSGLPDGSLLAYGIDGSLVEGVSLTGKLDVLGVTVYQDTGDVIFIEDDNVQRTDFLIEVVTIEVNHGSGTFRSVTTLTSGRIIAGVDDGTIYYSDDGGFTWSTGTTTLTGGAYSFTQGLDGIVYAGGASKIWASYNNGDVWVEVSSDPSIDVVGILTKADGEIYAGDTSQILVQEYQDYSSPIVLHVTNGHPIAEITHIKSYDDSLATYTDRFPNPTLPYPIWVIPTATTDITYFGVSDDSGAFTFSSVVINISTGGRAADLDFEYWSGATWAALPQSALRGLGSTALLSDTGQFAFIFAVPSDWATTTVDGVSGRWMRITIYGNGLVSPYQGSGNIYAIRNAFVEVASTVVRGDLPALAQIEIEVSSHTSDDVGYINRAVLGLRSYNRGSRFQAYLNASDQGNDPSLLVVAGTDTTFAANVQAPSNRHMVFSPTTTGSWVSVATFTFAGDLLQQYYGTYHVFLRCRQSGGSAGDIDFRLRTSTGSGGVQLDTVSKTLANTNDNQFIDFGRVTIPVSALLNTGETGDEANLIIQCNASSITPDIHFYDLVLMPVDEWYGDFSDQENSAVSPLTNLYYLDVDSVTFPKRSIRAQVRNSKSSQVKNSFRPIVNGEAILQANAQQRLWFFFARTASAASTDWRSEPSMAAKITLNATQRYLGMRGSR